MQRLLVSLVLLFIISAAYVDATRRPRNGTDHNMWYSSYANDGETPMNPDNYSVSAMVENIPLQAFYLTWWVSITRLLVDLALYSFQRVHGNTVTVATSNLKNLVPTFDCRGDICDFGIFNAGKEYMELPMNDHGVIVPEGTNMIAAAKLDSAVSVRKGNAEQCDNSPFAFKGLRCFRVSPLSPGSFHSTDLLFVDGIGVEMMTGAYLQPGTFVYVHRVLSEDYILRSGAWINRAKELDGGTSAARLQIFWNGARFLRKPNLLHKLLSSTALRFVMARLAARGRGSGNPLMTGAWFGRGSPLTEVVYFDLLWKLDTYDLVVLFFSGLNFSALYIYSVMHKPLAQQMKFLDNAVPVSVPASRQSLIWSFLKEDMFGTALYFGLALIFP